MIDQSATAAPGFTAVKIWGYSDDLIEVEGIDGSDEYSAADPYPWAGTITAPSGDQLLVRATFVGTDDLNWVISVENTTRFPSWKIHFEESPDHKEDAALVVEVPVGSSFSVLKAPQWDEG